MQIVEIDTGDFMGLRCPESGDRWLFEADIEEEGFMNATQLLERTFARGTVVDEVPESMVSSDTALAEAWSAIWLSAWDKAEEEDDFCELREVLATFEHDDLLALELTLHDMACGPITSRIYVLVPAEQWRRDLLIPDDAGQ